MAWRIPWIVRSTGSQRAGHDFHFSEILLLIIIMYYFCHVIDGGLVTKLCMTLTTPWTVVQETPLSMGFPRQEY